MAWLLDDQSVRRTADTVKWKERFTSRLARRPDLALQESAWSSLMLGQVEVDTADGAIGTALLYEGTAGSETVGTEQVYFVNKSGSLLSIGDDTWLCWPRLEGDHSGEAEAYWYALTAKPGGSTSWATIDCLGSYTPASVAAPLDIAKSGGTANITVAGNTVTISGSGTYVLTGAVTFNPSADPLIDGVLPPGQFRWDVFKLSFSNTNITWVWEPVVYPEADVAPHPTTGVPHVMPNWTGVLVGPVDVSNSLDFQVIASSVDGVFDANSPWGYQGQLGVVGSG